MARHAVYGFENCGRDTVWSGLARHEMVRGGKVVGDTLSGVIWRGMSRLAVGRCGEKQRERHCGVWKGPGRVGSARLDARRVVLIETGETLREVI